MKTEELASNITVINQPGQHLTGVPADWSQNKKGTKQQRLFWVAMNGQHYSEYSLVLELDKTVDMKEISLGFNSVWTDFNDKVLGIPSAVLLEGGLHPTDFTPLGSLQPLNDEGYSNVAVKVFVKNFNTIRSHQETEF